MEFLRAYSDSDDVDEDEKPSAGTTITKPAPAPAIVLPSASVAFKSVDGPPEFLNPEARRQFSTQHPTASNRHADVATAPTGGTDVGASQRAHGKQKKQVPVPDFDISRLAPPLKRSKRDNGGSSVIDIQGQVNPDAVIEGRAKRYKMEGPQGPQVSLAQIAMLGGNLPVAKGAASKALSVDEFLVGKGGNALMPRKGQDRRDKEKEKRSKGQSAIGSWKSEAEMVLRQQFDS